MPNRSAESETLTLIMRFARKFAAAIVVVIASPAAMADWSYAFVRIVCVPESGYVHLEYKAVSGPVVLAGAEHDERRSEERLRIWARHGFLSPRKLQRNCHLPEATYTIETDQDAPLPSGTCGLAPRITLNVKRNGAALVKDVPLGDNCIRGPSVESMEISEPAAGWGDRTLTLCTLGDAEQVRCKFLPADDIVRVTPITESLVREYANER